MKLCTSVGSNRKIPNLEPPEPLVNRTSNLPNLFLDFKTEPNLKRPNLEPLLILKSGFFDLQLFSRNFSKKKIIFIKCRNFANGCVACSKLIFFTFQEVKLLITKLGRRQNNFRGRKLTNVNDITNVNNVNQMFSALNRLNFRS